MLAALRTSASAGRRDRGATWMDGVCPRRTHQQGPFSPCRADAARLSAAAPLRLQMRACRWAAASQLARAPQPAIQSDTAVGPCAQQAQRQAKRLSWLTTTPISTLEPHRGGGITLQALARDTPTGRPAFLATRLAILSRRSLTVEIGRMERGRSNNAGQERREDLKEGFREFRVARLAAGTKSNAVT